MSTNRAWYDSDGKRGPQRSDRLLVAGRIRSEAHTHDEPRPADLAIADEIENGIRETLPPEQAQTGAYLSDADLHYAIWTDGRICAGGSMGACN
ncbi:MAG: hypothetical protein HOI34_19860 [Rhodospirillaceae bacterium]|jgi:hypothetical protein|nr:hypothetical protein [Rhodospirillaceae bacterium]MBT6205935.1 hypothetical protein [Rhodospirillaceae bacterium]MBT7595639.1 hypothetical protein [Gemmatimonadota bacterium]